MLRHGLVAGVCLALVGALAAATVRAGALEDAFEGAAAVFERPAGTTPGRQTAATPLPPLPSTPGIPETESPPSSDAGRTDGAEDGRKPLWELGVIGGMRYGPDWPGATETSVNGAGGPFVVYRGEVLQIGDGDAIRGRLVDTDRLKFDLSAAGSFAADSESSKAREGMPDLDFLVELGPRATVLLAENKESGSRLLFELPVRLLVSTDLENVDYRGVLANPTFTFQAPDLYGSGIRFESSFGPVLATEELHDYYYEVTPEFGTPQRPVYNAEAGYLGTELQIDLSAQIFDRVRLFGGVDTMFFEGARNRSSPLLGADATVTAGLGLAVTLWRSDAKAKR